jgi:hypothetical protein
MAFRAGFSMLFRLPWDHDGDWLSLNAWQAAVDALPTAPIFAQNLRIGSVELLGQPERHVILRQQQLAAGMAQVEVEVCGLTTVLDVARYAYKVRMGGLQRQQVARLHWAGA